MPQRLVSFFLLSLTVLAQDMKKLEFDAASIRPSAPRSQGESFGVRGGPGSPDPGRFTARDESLFNLILRAFSLQPDRIMAPDWLGTERFDVVVTLSPASTLDQFKQMLQSLLVSRFGLRYHYAKKDFPVYDLGIDKGGLKLKVSAVDPSVTVPREERPPRFALGEDGFPVLPPGDAPSGVTVSRNGVTSMSARGMALAGLIRDLQNALGGGARVVDQTGLTGRYDFRLRFASQSRGPSPQEAQNATPRAAEPAPDLLTALRDQLGLRLQKGSETFDVLVVDHLERTAGAD